MDQLSPTLEHLAPWSRNPRSIDKKSLEGLKVSLKEFGDLSGIVFNKQLNALVSGHQRRSVLPADAVVEIERRYEAPTSTGTVAEGFIMIGDERFRYREVDWSEARHAAANIAANSQRISGEYTQELGVLLDELHVSLPGLSEGLRFDDLRSELKDLFKLDTKEDQAPELPEEPKTKRGDVFELGPHRLVCGDCTLTEDVDRLMNNELAQLAFTDPPYNVDYESASGRTYSSPEFGGNGQKIFNDDKSEEDCLEFYFDALRQLYRVTRSDAMIYWWYASRNEHINRQAFIDSNWRLSQKIVWLKNQFIFSPGQEFHRCYEPCIVGWKEGEKHYTNKALANLSDLFSLDHLDFQEQFDIWFERRDATTTYVHPTQKPVRLAERAMKKSSRPNDIVVDFFGGSGSTLISAVQLKRRCFMMELDPKYCDVIVTRYCKYTGNTKITLNGVETDWPLA